MTGRPGPARANGRAGPRQAAPRRAGEQDRGPSSGSRARNRVSRPIVVKGMVAAMVLGLLRLVLVPLDAVGPSRPRRALRRLSLRFRARSVFPEF